MNPKTLLREHLHRIWRDLSSVQNLIDEIDFKVLSKDETSEIFFKTSKIVDSGELRVSGPDRIPDWESGWNEVLLEFEKNPTIQSLIPQYFGKHKYARLNSKFIGTNESETELNFLRIVETLVINEVMGLEYKNNLKIKNIYEFGCGTGHNLVYLATLFPELNYFGLDWSTKSQQLLQSIKNSGLLTNLECANFDFYNPDNNYQIGPRSIVITVATLEQMGSSHDRFVDYLLDQKPSYVIHIEPEQDFLDPENVVDQLSMRYSKNRGYLQGLLTSLMELQSKNELNILKAYRTGLGSYLLDGYSVIIWEPRI